MSTGISSQRTDAEKATVCFPMLVRSFVSFHGVYVHGHELALHSQDRILIISAPAPSLTYFPAIVFLISSILSTMESA